MKNLKNAKEFFIFFACVAISFLIFQFNILNTAPSFQFRTYRDGSEALILGKILADIKGVPIEKANLGFVSKGEGAPSSDVLSAYERINHVGKIVPLDLTDGNWNQGFANFGSVFLLKRTAVAELGYGVNELLPGESIQFSNQQIRTITQTKIIGEFLHVTYSGDRIDQKTIKSREISILNEKLNFDAYSKQYGLQGIFFSFIYKWSPSFLKNVSGLQALSALLFAIVLVLLARELGLLVDNKLGVIFFLCMIGSPWMVSVARNLYWVPVLWLLPVLVSFVLFRFIKSKSYSTKLFFLYGLLFSFSIFVKSLCGYEYLPVIFIFSLLPFFLDVGRDEQARVFNKPWQSCSIIFLFGVAGFLVAFSFHGALRSDDVVKGMLETVRSEAFKYNAVGPIIGAPSYGIKSSYIDLIVRYFFGWDSAVYFWINGKWAFPVLLLGSGIVVVVDFIKKSPVSYRNVILWVSSFLASVSWSILMKDHSIIHTHLNFVLWYLFFIPVATYVIFDFLAARINWSFLCSTDASKSQLWLEDYEKSKNNNFTLLRMILALSVLFGHSFPIVGRGSDPISVALLQPAEWIGSLAVHGFFFISGFLVVGSFVRRGAINYVLSRGLRLYPAILLYSILMVFLFGPIFSSANLAGYFSARPWFNLINAGLWEWNYNLPYIFESNPIPGATNGSTWTLPAELRSYILIGSIGFFGALDTKVRANCSLIGLLLLCTFSYTNVPMFGAHASFQLPLVYFLAGSIFWINKNLIVMNHVVTVLCFLLTVFSIRFGLLSSFLPLFMGYLFLVFVYRFKYVNVDRFGDLSYGIYIYAWPVQQLVWRPGQGPYENFVISLFFVLILAYLSWRIVEKPALNFRKVLVSR
ncbi:acyltransferase family protein [Uliginosibacterium gangwonense]|uniref:acyltransferase family protein n=1 Tax=Uliginosibacterium gangwonense TaxID=392736 RepID=UPI0003805C89|nr:acyltransferase [Uliginosibacterium gangwonense]